MHTFYLGIDVAKAKLDCALRLPEGKIRHKVLDNTPAGFTALRAWLAKHGADSVHVCMEATGIYWEAVAEFLASTETSTVSVVNPAQIKAFGGLANGAHEDRQGRCQADRPVLLRTPPRRLGRPQRGRADPAGPGAAP